MNSFATRQTEEVKVQVSCLCKVSFSLVFCLGFVFLLSNPLFSEKVGPGPWNAGGF